MIAQELLDKIARLDPPASDELEVPPRELIAFFVRFVRGLRQWKQSTLADFARVSVSTVERVERGDNVSDECLDRIAEGLGYERGYFTVPRSRLSLKEAADQLTKKYGELEAVKVGPLRTQRQLRGPRHRARRYRLADVGTVKLASLPRSRALRIGFSTR